VLAVLSGGEARSQENSYGSGWGYANFLELRYGEVQHSPTLIVQETPARVCPYRRVLCARRKDRGEGGLRASGRGKAKAALREDG